MQFVHTNIVSNNWKKLAAFYQNVFDCQPVLPVRNQSGEWLSKGTGVKNASLKGIHLRLPGYGESGPTLEIYQYSEILPSNKSAANRKGLGHIAFEVENVNATLNVVIKNGGSALGQVSETKVEEIGLIRFVYAKDPEGNILEIQSWDKTDP